MLSICLMDLPREIIYLIFEYLNKEHIAYSFLELNYDFSLSVKYFIGKQFDLTRINNDIICQYCLTRILPLIGYNLRSLSIDYSYCLLIYFKSIKNSCPNLDILYIYCSSEKKDIRYYVAHLIHDKLISLTFILNGEIIGEDISLRLLNKSIDEQEFERIGIASSLILHLSSTNDLILLKRYSESNYISNGLYMIESISTDQWLTDSKDDLCLMSKKFYPEGIFSIKQIDNEECSLEYQLYNQQTQRLTVLICCEDEEHWIPSSMLFAHRKESFRSCSAFTFEKIDNQNQFYIRPCYSHAKRLQVLRKRVIVSLDDDQNTPNHRFKLHRIS